MLVRYVDHHAQAVHLTNNFLAEVAQAVVFLFTAAGVGPVVCIVPGERHVTNAEPVELAQGRQRVFNRVTAFDPEQRRNLALAFREANVGD